VLFSTNNMTNKVQLIGWYGGDKRHALSAWTSTFSGNEALTADELFEKEQAMRKRGMPQLLAYLAKENHHTPFEKSMLDFRLVVDDATHIHFLKHRIGVPINAESARYKEVQDKAYIPYDWPEHLQNELKELIAKTDKFYHKALLQLTPILGRKRAKESARYAKMKCSQLALDVAFNFRSFVHFQNLRNVPGVAQDEVCHIANEMLRQVVRIPGQPFYHSIEAFGLAERLKAQ
jgi:thymidylate synthase ThyX